ncbi:UNVERIFIED_CONTAM: Pentatricopeptide repeat-containing protein [Sesamum latifolium]|uniref:Pentatricopeptide repeat-containing protein n=1 Tax=Sesamum latifolium TaxID=2727402 RepID=A0AAW2XQI9_9LAMI
MELLLHNPPNLRLSSFKVESSSKNSLDCDHNSQSLGLQFSKLSKKDLSRISRKKAAIKAIEKKANSFKYKNLWPKAVLEALSDAIKQNHWEYALKIFSLLCQQHWYEPRTQTYAKLLVMLGKCTQPNQASMLSETMLSDGLRPTVDVYTTLVGAYAFNGLVDKAFSIVEDMKYVDNCKPDAFTLYGKSGLYQKMGSVMEFMKKRIISSTIVTYNIVIEVFGKAEKIEKMDEMFLKMKHQSLKPNSITYSFLVSTYSKAGLSGKVDSILRQVHKSDVVLDTSFFNFTINAYGNAVM